MVRDRSRRAKVKTAMSWIYLCIIVLFLYIPILVLIVLSFNNSKSRVKWGGFTLKWYGELFASSHIMEALQTTLAIGLVAAFLATLLGTLAAIGIQAMKRRNYSIVMSITNIPILNADIVTGIALMLWIVKFMPLGFASVLIAHTSFCIPYVILSVMPKLKTLNINSYEAALDLGASNLYAFITVVLPQIAGGIVSGFFLAFTMSMDDFVITYFTKGAGVNTLSTLIYGEIKKGIKPEMYALSTLLFAIILILLLIVNFASSKEEDRKTQ